MASLEQTFAALADPSRREVVDLLRQRPHRAGELADRLGLSPQAMSRHLRVLRTSGLIEPTGDERDARVRLYGLRREAFAGLRGWLDEVEAHWTLELAAFKAHVAATRSPSRRRRP